MTHMKKVQQGFTLIELMIVVAIIGILAAVAIPQYSDYVTKTKISEIMTLVDGCKTALGENFADVGTLPAQADAAGPVGEALAQACLDSLATSESISAATDVTYTQTDADTAVIEVTLTGIPALAANNVIEFIVDGAGPIFGYNCSTTSKKGIAAAANTTVEEKYLPQACRP